MAKTAHVDTATFYEAFGHTYEEADLLEEWCETLSEAQVPLPEACTRFEAFLRNTEHGVRSLQTQLKEPQLRPSVRTACRTEASRQVIIEVGSPHGQSQSIATEANNGR